MNKNRLYLSGHLGQDLQKAEELRFFLLRLFVFMLPFDRFYTSLVLIVLIATTLVGLTRERLKSIPRQFWIFQAVFLLALAGYPYSHNKHEASFLIERQLAIFILPLLLPLAVKFSQDRLRTILFTLCLSSVFTALLLFANVVYVIKSGGLPLQYALSKEFFNHNFSAPLDIHAGYLSLYFSFSLLYLIRQVLTTQNPLRKALFASGIFLLSMALFFLASRNTLIATLLLVLFIVPLFFVRNKVRFYVISGIVLASCILIFSKVSYINQRFSSNLIADILTDSNSEYKLQGAEPRILRWEAALELIACSPAIGYGTGDEIDMLKTKYVEHELFVSYIESFNAHNQYLSYALKNGIAGLVVFLGLLAYYLALAIRSKSFVYTCFLLLIVIGFFSENILDANKGIFFFAFFNTFIGYTLLDSRKEKPAGPVE